MSLTSFESVDIFLFLLRYCYVGDHIAIGWETIVMRRNSNMKGVVIIQYVNLNVSCFGVIWKQRIPKNILNTLNSSKYICCTRSFKFQSCQYVSEVILLLQCC